MAGAKYVVRNPKVFLNPAGANVDVSKWFTEFSPGFTVVEVETMAFGDVGDATEKGSSKDTLKVKFFHSADYTEFTKLLINELRSTGNTTWLFKNDDGVVSDATPSFQCDVKICNVGDLFGAKNTAPSGNPTWRVQGQWTITYSGGVTVNV